MNIMLRKYKLMFRKFQNFVFTYILPKGSRRYVFYKYFRNKIMVYTLLKKLRGREYRIDEFSGSYDVLSVERTDVTLVSIIIPVYNEFRYTYLCIASIIKNTKDVDYEIIIADDVSTDETVDILKYCKNIVVSRNKNNIGFLRNCNQAAKKAKGKYILFLNNDTQVQDRWLSTLVSLMENDSSVGMTGSKLIYPDGKLQEAGGILWKDGSAWNYGKGDYSILPEYNYVRETDYISGAAIMIRKTLWKKIGGFDERFVPAYCEDSDLAFQIRKLGYKVVYQPKSVVVHFEGVSHGTDTEKGIKQYQIDNKTKFLHKWKKVLEEEHFSNGENVFQARDRSRKKKTVLVIDHYVPRFDRDAGSKTSYQYLALFVKMGLNVKFLGDNFFPYEPYTSALESMGVEVLYGPYMANNWKRWIKDNSAHIDFIYLNRPQIAEKYIDFLKKNTNARIYYYGHDLHFLREHRRYEVEGGKALLSSSKSWKKREYRIFEKADKILYPSHVEIDILKKDISEEKLSPITPYLYESPIDCKYNSRKRSGIMFVGGFAHAPNIDAVHWFMNSIKPYLDTYGYKDKIFIVGSNPPKDIIEYASEQVEITGFISEERLAELYSDVRLVIVPLRYGAGIKGKIVESMVNKVPFVTTTVGAEGLPNIHKVAWISDEGTEMAATIADSYKNYKELDRRAVLCGKYIEKYFTVNSAIKQFSGWFR